MHSDRPAGALRRRSCLCSPYSRAPRYVVIPSRRLMYRGVQEHSIVCAAPLTISRHRARGEEYEHPFAVGERKYGFSCGLFNRDRPTITEFRATQQQLIGIEVALLNGGCLARSGDCFLADIDTKESGRADFLGSPFCATFVGCAIDRLDGSADQRLRAIEICCKRRTDEQCNGS